MRVPLGADGTVPVWLTAGPFEQPTTGFGTPADRDAVGEATADPQEGDTEDSVWADGGTVSWRPAAPGADGFLDFHAAFADVAPGAGPEKVWWAKTGYAATTIHSETAQDVLLLTGSNSRLSVFLDGTRIHHAEGLRNAVVDQDTVRLSLRPGTNRLLVKVGQSHRNEGVQFFVPIEWQWGVYARIVTPSGAPSDLTASVQTAGDGTDAALASSFFFRDEPGPLEQRLDLALTRRTPGVASGEIRVAAGGRALVRPLDEVPFGLSRHAVWLPPIEAPTEATLEVLLDGEAPITQTVTLRPQPRYELHLMLLSHTDVGYTHPQPTVAEKHALLLDAVVAKAEAEPDFRWTIETVWQLEQFAAARSPEAIERLVGLIREGRVAVSASYTNPFMGWTSEEEFLHSLAIAHDLAERYGIELKATVLNDEPGFSWLLPGALREIDAPFVVAGLNEVYSDYAHQRTLPKAFRWEGADGRAVTVYRTEAYNEGQTYGLVKGVAATESRMYERLGRLRADGHPYDIVLLNTTFGDNGGIAEAELDGARAWNAAYAYPRFVVSTLDRFAEAFTARYDDTLPTLRGDWTSDWDVLYQGELARTVRQRWAQHHLPLAEALGTAAWLEGTGMAAQPLVDEAYRHLLQYSAHGSGLEAGYGGPDENAVTVAFREGYVQDAVLATEAAMQRAGQRLVAPREAFDGEAVFVFNGSGERRDAPVAVEFAHDAGRYRVVDAETGAELPSTADGHHLRFVARDLPAVGYRTLRLEPRGEVPATDLTVGLRVIENAFYRLEMGASGALVSARAKATNTELVRPGDLPFGVPTRAVFGEDVFRPLGDAIRIEVMDERPARLRLVAYYDGVIPRVTYTLWEDLDRVEVEALVDLEAFEPVEATETYGLPFPFALGNAEPHLGVLGGFLSPDERFPGVTRDAYALRQSLALATPDATVSWASADTRVARLLEPDATGAIPAVLAVLAHQFPEAWNRNEENEGQWPLRFAFTAHAGPLDAAATDAFGRGLAQSPYVYPTWLTAEEPVRDYLLLGGDPVHLLAFQGGEDERGHYVMVRLRNPRPDAPADVILGLPYHTVVSAARTSFAHEESMPLALDAPRSGTVALRLNSDEIVTVRLDLAPTVVPSPSSDTSSTSRETP